jgi:hypothetical protein
MVTTRSASPITAPRIAATTEGWSSGTRPRLSPVSRYSAPVRSSSWRSAAPAPRGAAAGDHQRPARRPQQIDRRLHRAGSTGSRRGAGGVAEGSGSWSRPTPRRAACRPGSPGTPGRVRRPGPGAGHGLVERLQHQVGVAHGARIAGQRRARIRCAPCPAARRGSPAARRCARQHQHRRARHVRVGDAGHRVGHARPGGDQGHPEAAVSSACACAM